MLFLLQFGQLNVTVIAHELFDPHEASSDSNHKTSIDNLGRDLLGPKVVLVRPDSLHGDWTAQTIDIVSEKFVYYVANYSFVEFPGFLRFLKLGTELLILLLAVFDLPRYVLKLLDQANYFLLSLSVHLKEPEYGFLAVERLTLLAEMIELIFSFISVLPNVLILPLHVLDLTKNVVQLLLNLSQLAKQVYWLAFLIQQVTSERLYFTLLDRPFLNFGNV